MSDAASADMSAPDDASDVPPFPALVKVAGIMWIAYGCLMLLNVVVTLGLSGQPPAPAAAGPQPPAVGSSGGCLGILFGIGFFVAGVQSLRGTARDTLGNSIGSFVIGALGVGVGGLFLAWGNIGAVIPIVAGACLIVAGILALMGRADYKRWRAVHRARLRAESQGPPMS
jgi:hypothetical protein